MATLIDSIPLDNQTGTYYRPWIFGMTYSEAFGMVFKVGPSHDGYAVTSLKAKMYRGDDLSGTIYARIYDSSQITGTIGESAHPSDLDEYLAQSDGVSYNDVGTSWGTITFNFSSLPIVSEGNYFWVIYFPDADSDGDHDLRLNKDWDGTPPSGYNRAYMKSSKTDWAAYDPAVYDGEYGFEIYGTLPISGGSEVDVDITADGGGNKKTESGSETDTDITADGGAGEKIAYSTSSYGAVSITAEGGGKPLFIGYFLDTPSVNIQAPLATHVKVKSPEYTAGYTATVTPAPTAGEEVYRLVEIEEGNATVCQNVAEELIDRWSVEQKSVIGKIPLNVTLDFKRKIHVNIPWAGIDEEMILQRKVHNIKAKEMFTEVTLGDIILSDEELIARIIDDLL